MEVMTTTHILDGSNKENLISKQEPTSLCCPISKALFRDPVIIPCTGYTYEREWILKHFQTKVSDPITGELVTGELQVNRAMRDAVQEWIQVNDIPRDAYPLPPDPDNLTQTKMKTLHDVLDTQMVKWRQLRSRLKELGCKNMSSAIILTDANTLVKEIYLSGSNISKIPEEIYEFTYLEALYVDNNRIQSISPKIAQLKNLKIFNAADNKLKTIPNEILKLKKLEYLNLDNNELENFPDEFKLHSFRELREFRVQNNKLTDIDFDICKNNVLCRLFLSGNTLTNIDKFHNDLGLVKG